MNISMDMLGIVIKYILIDWKTNIIDVDISSSNSILQAWSLR